MSPTRLAWVLLPLVTLTAASARSADDEPELPAQRELKRLEGKWKLVTMVSHGTRLPEERLRHLYVEIRGDLLMQWSEGEGKPRSTVRIKLDPAAMPQAIDILGQVDGKVLSKGIYTVEDGRLKVCHAPPVDVRPKAFASEANSRTTLLVHERVKP